MKQMTERTKAGKPGGKNYELDLWKLGYAFIIVGYHFYNTTSHATKAHLIGGNSAVSFFLLVSGMLLFASFEKREQTGMLTPGRFFLHRYRRFFPAIAIAYLFTSILIRCVVSDLDTSKIPNYLTSDLWEIMLVKMNGMNGNKGFLNGPAWTVSSIFLVGCAFWCFLYTEKRRFLNLILPITLIIGFGMTVHLESGSHEKWMGITTAGTMRAWNLMGLGYYCYLLSKHIRVLRLNTAGRVALTAAELVCHMVALWCMEYRSTSGFRWTSEFMFSIAAAISFSGQGFIGDWLRRFPLSKYLADFSLAVYLVHRPLMRLFEKLYGADIFTEKWLYLAVLLLASAAFQVVVLTFGKVCDAVARGCKRAFCRPAD